MKYIKRDGTTVDWLPKLEDYIEDDQDATIAQNYAVQMLDEDLNVIATEFLMSNSYPKELELKWCLLKYRPAGAVYASVKKLHTLEYREEQMKMQRMLELTLRLNKDDFEVDVYEPETGECTKMQFPYSPDEHPGFDKAIGEEIYSWLCLWADERGGE